ncbi:50S ribosomal protein L4 [Candidatus Pacearchaeota archaeon]|nr:MAG: 50S ribosomal protein L4 [Candidatus Pacearchaeota archaeon]
MKVEVYNPNGEKAGQIELPKVFETEVREDLALKLWNVARWQARQPYGTDERAGMKSSAYGKVRHARNKFKSHYGRAIARVPRKTMWRRGTQFYWIAAGMPGVRGGRRAHPPKVERKEKKINKKEAKLALFSAIASSAKKEFILARYASLTDESKLPKHLPIVLSELPSKTKELTQALKKILGEGFEILKKKKSVRAGKGKMRGRRYKANQGVLVVTASDEESKIKSFDIIPLKKLKIQDIYPLGRLTIYTKAAMEELAKIR